MQSYDIIIIGAGIVGAMVARTLARYDLDVLWIEKESDICTGATAANSAIGRGKSSIAGKPSKRCRAGVSAQGSFSFVIVSMKGENQLGSSSRVGRTLRKASRPAMRVNIQLMQLGQK